MAAAAAQSYAVVYAVDLNARDVSLTQSQPLGGQRYTEIQSRLQSLGSLTAETDGELFNDASAHIEQVMNDISETSQDYYLVGFAPSAAALRDRSSSRHVSVRVHAARRAREAPAPATRWART